MPRDDAKENVGVVDADVRANAKALNAARADAVALATELGATVERNQTLERLADRRCHLQRIGAPKLC